MHFGRCSLLCGATTIAGRQCAGSFSPKFQDHRHTASLRAQDEDMAIFCATFSEANQAPDGSVSMDVVILTIVFIPAESILANIQRNTAALDAYLSEYLDCFYGKETLSAISTLTPKDINWNKDQIYNRVTEILPESFVPITIDGSITAKPVWPPVQVTATTGILKATNAATPTKHPWALDSATAFMVAGSIVLALVLGCVGWSIPGLPSF